MKHYFFINYLDTTPYPKKLNPVQRYILSTTHPKKT